MRIIDNYRDLPIGKYVEITQLAKDESVDALTQQVKTIAILTDREEDDILNLPIVDYKEMVSKTQYLSFPYEGEVLTAKKYIIGEWTLLPIEDFKKITTAQYVDFQAFAKEPEKNIVELLSTMLVPKGKKYNQDYDILKVQDAIRKELSVVEALSLLAFFFVQYRQSIKDSLTYCRESAMRLRDTEKRKRILKEIQKQEDLLLKGGVGLPT